MTILNTELDEIVLSGNLSSAVLDLTEEDIDTLLLDSTIWAKLEDIGYPSPFL